MTRRSASEVTRRGGLAMALATLVAVATGAALCISLPSCRDDASPTGSGSVTSLPEARGVLDERLMIGLAQAKNLHHKAQIRISEGKLDDAIAQVRQVLQLPFPDGAAEAEDVRVDAHALLGTLLLTQGKLDEALAQIDQGLAVATRDSFFVANLHTVRGEIFEARGNLLAAQGESQSALASDARKQAIAEFDRAIAINERLQRQLMEEH